MKVFTVQAAKRVLEKLIAEAANGEEIFIQGSNASAKLVAIPQVRGKRRPGALKGKLRLGPEFFEPLPARELRLWK
jgi:antitoxin (DNA-binding transcriptional repressor) of toxin-antitoxin stability system